MKSPRRMKLERAFSFQLQKGIAESERSKANYKASER
jgi:ribosome modulation factor